MSKTIEYYPKGVCSRRFDITLEDGIIQSMKIEGGCDGNAQGLMRLLPGMSAREVVSRLSGIRCERRPTSCPDQIARALKNYID